MALTQKRELSRQSQESEELLGGSGMEDQDTQKYTTITRVAAAGAALIGFTAIAVTCVMFFHLRSSTKAHASVEEMMTEEAKTITSCPYDFSKPLCENAEVQSPRDLSTGATGLKKPKVPALPKHMTKEFLLTNTHFHLGAEHKTDEASDDTKTQSYDPSDEHATRPGFMCAKDGLTEEELQPYEFKYCSHVEVGVTYEIHYVYSTAGEENKIADGLGGAANGRGQLNPMINVKAQIVQIVNGPDAPEKTSMINSWDEGAPLHSVMYPGSTTGTSFDNQVCSPYTITWYVNKACVKVSAASFDNMCKDMKDHGMSADTHPHSCRVLLDEKWVVPAEYVKKIV